jgi:hypothetical protein
LISFHVQQIQHTESVMAAAAGDRDAQMPMQICKLTAGRRADGARTAQESDQQLWNAPEGRFRRR